jgi:hypothetical protein
VNILRKFVDVAGVVLDVLAPVDFRFGGFNPRPNLALMRIFLDVVFNQAPYGRSDRASGLSYSPRWTLS